MERLKSYARDWEKGIMEATESELALIRDEVNRPLKNPANSMQMV